MKEDFKWKFDYKGEEYFNELKRNASDDFMFVQNKNSLFMGQGGERFFLGLLIYGMQKIKSPEKAKKDLSSKIDHEELKKLEKIDFDPLIFIDSTFLNLDKFREKPIGDYNSNFPFAKINEELNIFKGDKNIIKLPYEQISKSIDYIMIQTGKQGIRSAEMSKIMDYYVSGEFEKMMKKLDSTKI
jgi:hypothetical protein